MRVDSQHHWSLREVAANDCAARVAHACLEIVIDGAAIYLQKASMERPLFEAGVEDIDALEEFLAGVAAD